MGSTKNVELFSNLFLCLVKRQLEAFAAFLKLCLDALQFILLALTQCNIIYLVFFLSLSPHTAKSCCHVCHNDWKANKKKAVSAHKHHRLCQLLETSLDDGSTRGSLIEQGTGRK